jgi:hypothetical protein
MLINGYYKMEVRAGANIGNAVVRVAEGNIAGSDNMHHYSGSLRDATSPLSSYLRIDAYGNDNGLISGEYSLSGVRRLSDTDLAMTGSLPGGCHTIRVRLSWNSPLTGV